jgi:DNA polymerase III epsilon subunit-like protein
MRQIVLDTETTGLDWKTGDRLIEIAGVEIIDRKLTGRHYHVYVNPSGHRRGRGGGARHHPRLPRRQAAVQGRGRRVRPSSPAASW